MHRVRRNLVMGVYGLSIYTALRAQTRNLPALMVPSLPAQTPITALQDWVQFAAAAPPGAEADEAHLLLDVPDIATSGSLQISVHSSLSSTSRMALFMAPTPRGVAALDAKFKLWQPIVRFDLLPAQSPEFSISVALVVPSSFLLAAVAGGKMYKVIKSVKVARAIRP
jgi:hypothetical protein